jgi:hypothetical protein
MCHFGGGGCGYYSCGEWWVVVEEDSLLWGSGECGQELSWVVEVEWVWQVGLMKSLPN